MEQDNQLFIDIITPNGSVFSGEIDSCQAPGKNGKFQVLPGHTSMLSVLNVGTVKVILSSGQDNYIAISGGFFETEKNKVMVLAESAERAESIDIPRAENAKERALKRLQGEKDQIDIKRAEAALARALNRLQTAQRSYN